MRAHRLVRSQHATRALDGEGARLYGGRWNPPGIPLAYCSSSLALAVLELLVHLDPVNVPGDLVAVQVEIPDSLRAAKLEASELPEDWRREGGKTALRHRGTDWARAGAEAVLSVPSVVVPEERNLLINPRHPDAGRIAIVRCWPFSLDPRLVREDHTLGR